MTRRPITAQQNDDGPLDQEFEKLVNETMELWHVPGVAVAVIDGENTWAKVPLFFEGCPIILNTFSRATALPHSLLHL